MSAKSVIYQQKELAKRSLNIAPLPATKDSTSDCSADPDPAAGVAAAAGVSQPRDPLPFMFT
jgi:hypothetical protein